MKCKPDIIVGRRFLTAREQLLNRLRAGYHNAGKKQKSEAIHTLMLVGGYAWKASNFLCGFRLKAAIPLFLEHMVLSGELNPDTQTRVLLLSVSDTTLDRLLPHP